MEETSASDWSSNEEENNKDNSGPADVEVPNHKQDVSKVLDEIVQDTTTQQEDENKVDLTVPALKTGNGSRRLRDDTGNDADMDDTSMSSRASSRMLESINVISMDSMNVM